MAGLHMKGSVFNVQRFSIHDGPGIRSVAFFKGCNLNCWWCHNPEGKNSKPQLQCYPEKCVGCERCLDVCPNGCFSIVDGKKAFAREKCMACGACAEACPAQSLVLCGREWSSDELAEELLKDKIFFEDGGGVTITGGECMMQVQFLAETLEKCKREGVHTAIETAANVPFRCFQEVLPWLDLVIVDIKCISEEVHKRNVGVSNRLILENIDRLLQLKKAEVWIRVPIIPQFNMDTEELGRIADYIGNLEGVSRVELMKYHSLGNSKLKSLGSEPTLDVSITDKDFSDAVDLFRERGVKVVN